MPDGPTPGSPAFTCTTRFVEKHTYLPPRKRRHLPARPDSLKGARTFPPDSDSEEAQPDSVERHIVRNTRGKVITFTPIRRRTHVPPPLDCRALPSQPDVTIGRFGPRATIQWFALWWPLHRLLKFWHLCRNRTLPASRILSFVFWGFDPGGFHFPVCTLAKQERRAHRPTHLVRFYREHARFFNRAPAVFQNEGVLSIRSVIRSPRIEVAVVRAKKGM